MSKLLLSHFKIATAVLLSIIITLFSKHTRATENGKVSLSARLYVQNSKVPQDQSVVTFPDSFERPDYQQFPQENQYHSFQHHQHHGYQMTETNHETSKGNSQSNNYKNSSMPPIDLFWKMNNYTDLNDLLIDFVDDVEEDTQLESRFSDGERTAAIVPKPAACMPELRTVQIATEDDPSVIYIPSCTRVERCGGCCSHNLFSCQPVDTETVSFQVVKTKFMGGSKLKYMGKEIKLVERHLKCKCDCKVKEEDCNRFQQYRKSECRCACINTDEEKKCYKENATKLWDPNICTCQCRNILQCSTGYTFDMFSCKCVPALVRRRFAELEVDDDQPDY